VGERPSGRSGYVWTWGARCEEREGEGGKARQGKAREESSPLSCVMTSVSSAASR
jgi:hypothetical protein